MNQRLGTRKEVIRDNRKTSVPADVVAANSIVIRIVLSVRVRLCNALIH